MGLCDWVRLFMGWNRWGNQPPKLGALQGPPQISLTATSTVLPPPLPKAFLLPGAASPKYPTCLENSTYPSSITSFRCPLPTFATRDFLYFLTACPYRDHLLWAYCVSGSVFRAVFISLNAQDNPLAHLLVCIYPSIHPSTVRLFLCLPIHLPIHLAPHSFTCLFIHPPVHLSIHPLICLSTHHPPILPFVYLSIVPSIQPPVCPFI